MLRRSVLTGAAALLASPALPRPSITAPAPDRQVSHVLDRLAFGPSADDFDHVKRVGIERYIAEQLTPEAIPEPAALTERLAKLSTLQLDPIGLFAEYGPLRPVDGKAPSQDEQRARRQRARIIHQEA